MRSLAMIAWDGARAGAAGGPGIDIPHFVLKHWVVLPAVGLAANMEAFVAGASRSRVTAFAQVVGEADAPAVVGRPFPHQLPWHSGFPRSHLRQRAVSGNASAPPQVAFVASFLAASSIASISSLLLEVAAAAFMAIRCALARRFWRLEVAAAGGSPPAARFAATGVGCRSIRSTAQEMICQCNEMPSISRRRRSDEMSAQGTPTSVRFSRMVPEESGTHTLSFICHGVLPP